MKLNMSIYLILHLLVSINAYMSFTPRILHVPTTWKWKRLLNFSFFHPSPYVLIGISIQSDAH